MAIETKAGRLGEIGASCLAAARAGPAAAGGGPPSVSPEGRVPALVWIAALALLSTALGTLAGNRGLAHVSAATMASFVFLQPLVGLAIGTLGLGESVGGLALLSTALIVAGVVIAALRGEKEPASTPALRARKG